LITGFNIHLLRDQPHLSAKVLHSAFEKQAPVEILITLSKNSILDISISAFACLTNMCNFYWGCKELADSTSFHYFLERKPELSNVVKEWKFSVLKAIIAHPNCQALFAPSVFRKIQEFVKDGPFKVVYNPQVSFESS
jgi:Proteasome non-ATPase 26S subunit